MESEFFGYRKGAFTGADSERDGFFQAASGGTLFLDEVADLPLAMQVKLLRAIQEKRVRKVGAATEEAGRRPHHLRDAPESARLRRQGQLPPGPLLPAERHRTAHAVAARAPGRHPAAGHDLAEAARRRRAVPRVTAAALQALAGYPFPGNVRELENILERAIGPLLGRRDRGRRPATGAG